MTKSYGKRRGRTDGALGVRDVASTYGKVRVAVPSVLHGGLVQVEGVAEGLVATTAELAPGLFDWKPQPFTVELPSRRILLSKEEISAARAEHRGSRQQCTYTPDLFLRFTDGRPVVVEVRTEDFEGGPTFLDVLRKASRIAEDEGYRFEFIVLPRDQASPLLRNVRALHQALGVNRRDAKCFDHLDIEGASAAGCATLGDYCQFLRIPPDQSTGVLAAGLLAADFGSELISNELRVEPARGDLSHLNLFDRLPRRSFQ